MRNGSTGACPWRAHRSLPFVPRKTIGPAASATSRISASRLVMCRNVWSPLLQAELLSGREQVDRFADAPRARLRPLREVNPDDEVAPVGGRELTEERPRVRIRS